MTSFLIIAFGNKSPVFSNENGITRTKLLSMIISIITFRSRATTAKKCTKKCDARANLLFR